MPTTKTIAVRNLQTYLRQLAYHDPTIPPPRITGFFDGATRLAVRAFQRRAGLPESGTATRETWDALYTAYRASLTENALPVRVSVFPVYPPGCRLGPGCAGFPVAVLQYLLAELQYETAETPGLEITGTYDEATAAAVRAFQKCCGSAECDGTVDLATWNALADRYNALCERPPSE